MVCPLESHFVIDDTQYKTIHLLCFDPVFWDLHQCYIYIKLLRTKSLPYRKTEMDKLMSMIRIQELSILGEWTIHWHWKVQEDPVLWDHVASHRCSRDFQWVRTLSAKVVCDLHDKPRPIQSSGWASTHDSTLPEWTWLELCMWAAEHQSSEGDRSCIASQQVEGEDAFFFWGISMQSQQAIWIGYCRRRREKGVYFNRQGMCMECQRSIDIDRYRSWKKSVLRLQDGTLQMVTYLFGNPPG